jgi:hypothetical protein
MQAIVSILVLRQAPYSLSRSASPEKRIDVVMRRRSPGRSGGAKPAVPRTSPGDDDDYSNEINKGTGFTARPFYRSHRPLTSADALRVAIPGCRRPLCARERRVPGPCGPRTDATLDAEVSSILAADLPFLESSSASSSLPESVSVSWIPKAARAARKILPS